MNLYRISQNANNDYDTYDSAVVAAPDESTARIMNPWNGSVMSESDWSQRSSWCSSPNDVQVELIGVASEGRAQGLILSSYKAG